MKMRTTVSVAGIQMDIKRGDPAGNLAKVSEHIRERSKEGVFLTVFPEAVVSGYCFDSLEEILPFAETVPGPSVDAVEKICKELKVATVLSLLERENDLVFNSSVLIGPNGIVGKYRKVHLPFLGADRFTAMGDKPFQVHEVEGIRVGMMICYDGTLPESCRIQALQGADLVVLPTNWGVGAERVPKYVINTRALENHLYFLAVNRVGEENGSTFIGHSTFCDPKGDTIDSLVSREEGVIRGEVDVSQARNKKIVRIPGKVELDYVEDRQPKFYSRLCM